MRGRGEREDPVNNCKKKKEKAAHTKEAIGLQFQLKN